MNIRQRRRAMLYRMGYTPRQIELIQRKQIGRMVGIAIGVGMFFLPAENYSNAGIVLVVFCTGLLLFDRKA